MVGGDDEAVQRLEPVFTALAPEDGYAHVGPSGAGHFTKMVHNGIEYGLMQAYAEGFEVMAKSEFDLDLHEIAGIWRYGSVVRSWLLELLHDALRDRGQRPRSTSRGYVEDSGEGRWTVAEAIAEDVPVPVITAALFARFASRQDESFAAKVNAALRNQFGGHAVREQPSMTAQRDAPENPLLEGLQLRRTPEPCVLVIFGASGDLTQRKLMPALYSLAYRRLLPERFAVVGAARTEETDDEFRERMKEAVQAARARRVPGGRLGAARRRACATCSTDFARRGVRGPARERCSTRSTRSAARTATASTTSPSRRTRSRRSCSEIGERRSARRAGRG